MNREEVLDLLHAAADPAYKEFNDRIANCNTAPSIGVRVPGIREVAAAAAKGDWRSFLDELEQAERDGILLWQEEHMLWGIVIGRARTGREERTVRLDRWIPGIVSWADCDCSVSSFKFMKKEQAFWFDYCCGWLKDGREFPVRFALVALMQYFINDEYIDRVLEIFAGQPWSGAGAAQQPYYVRMAQAWALSVCFVKYRDRTLPVLTSGRMDGWVCSKAIQKCRESFRVSKEDKELLKKWKEQHEVTG